MIIRSHLQNYTISNITVPDYLPGSLTFYVYADSEDPSQKLNFKLPLFSLDRVFKAYQTSANKRNKANLPEEVLFANLANQMYSFAIYNNLFMVNMLL